MPASKQYLNVLIEGLQKKNRILKKILELNEQQAQLIKEKESLEAFDHLVDEKEKWIDELNRIDKGFQSVYDRVRIDLLDHRNEYAAEIKALQEQIREMTDYHVAIQTSEQRNKQAIERYFKNARESLQSNRKSLKAANDYYKNMSRTNYVDPQLMDQKK